MKELIYNEISDLATSFLYYDRKEDDELPRGAIEKAIKDGVITELEIVQKFKESLINGLNN